jgi:eukaryotic-like serine/threonine-protein kinase
LLERIAVGGMAEVFLARKAGPEGFEKRVALKRILPHLSRQPDFVTMFLDEARLSAGLCHSHVVQLHDFGVDGDTYYLAMEHVAGHELQSLIRRAAELDRPLPLADAVTLLVGACEGLHHVHERGIIHRDVTPSNLLISWDGVVKLTDFGIAKLETRAAQTQAGALKGKIAYMSPEQAQAAPLDRRTDVYSLGVCAWELLTLRRMRPDDNELRLLESVQSGAPPPPSGLPASLEAVILRALAPDREQRFPTARALGEALSAWLAASGIAQSSARLADHMRDYFGEPGEALAIPNEPTARHSRPGGWLPLIPLHLPRLRLLLPLIAFLLSLGGLLFALRSQPREIAPPSPPKRVKMWSEGSS